MKSNCIVAMLPPFDQKPTLTQISQRLRSSGKTKYQHLKYFKLVEIFMVITLRYAKDEQTSTLSYIKTKLKNCLIIHLDLIIKTNVQKVYSLATFSFYVVIQDWHSNKCHCDLDLQGITRTTNFRYVPLLVYMFFLCNDFEVGLHECTCCLLFLFKFVFHFIVGFALIFYVMVGYFCFPLTLHKVGCWF